MTRFGSIAAALIVAGAAAAANTAAAAPANRRHAGVPSAPALLAGPPLGKDALGLALSLRRPPLRAALSPLSRLSALSLPSLVLKVRCRAKAAGAAPRPLLVCG